MNDSNSNSSQGSPQLGAPQITGFSPLQWLKSKRISYLTLPLLIMATVTEYVILATGWKYQRTVCLPKGMAVTFFGIGPIGATILAVELLKLPLAIWTASRSGWRKYLMVMFGLPVICLLTFQLVKDMAVYEMGIALAPASEFLDQATKEEVKISQLEGQLAAIDQKKTDRDSRLADLAAKQVKAKADIEDSLKRNDDTRQDAISLTDYQRKELADVDSRESTIIQQFNADTEQINKALVDLRAQRETELARAAKWNAEEARIDNAYKAKMAVYANAKALYDKDKADYDNANFLKRQVMKEPVDPGVPPVREVNTLLKPVELEALDAQISSKQGELATVNARRRDRVAQVEADAQQLRQEFDHRSSTKREQSDQKRDQMLAAETALVTQEQTEAKQINGDYDTAAKQVDAIRAELDDARKTAEGYYEAREQAIKGTQVHRIATTVEIIRGLLMGQRPVSITSTAKERGDLYTDQISMVRIWVYPVLAFIVAYLPTLLVEIGFSTVFHPEKEDRPAHRLGFFGTHLHKLYIRAGRHKILRAERLAAEVTAQIAARDKTLAAAKTSSEQAIAARDVELQAAREAMSAAAASHEAEVKRRQEEHAEELKKTRDEWVAKVAGMANSLNRAEVEKDSLRDLQRSEVERQIQARQIAWSDRLTQLQKENDSQRAAAEAERNTLVQEHHKKLFEVSEDCKTQVAEARRRASDAELAAMEASARLTLELKEALRTRDLAEAQLHQQADTFAIKLNQAKEDAAREVEKAARQERHRVDRQKLELDKTLRQRDEDFEHRLEQREHELTLAFDARLVEEQSRVELEVRRREAELDRQVEERIVEVEARWKKEAQQKEELFQSKLRLRDQQWQVKLDAARAESQAEADEMVRRRESEATNNLREQETRLRKEMQQKEEAAQLKFKQREQEVAAQIAAQAEARHSAARVQWETETEIRTRSAVEPFKSLLIRTEKERDEALQSVAEGARQVQDLEKKLTEASSFLNPWRNGRSVPANS
jgi:hypothetical protein